MSEANRFAQSRDPVFQREEANARRVHLVRLNDAESLAPRSLHRHDEQSSQTLWQHKTHAFEGFTDDHNCTRLVYRESFDDVANAIDREKQLKRWRREKKLWLIERKNPGWKDLAADWYPKETQGPSTSLGMTQLQLRGLKAEV